MNLVSKEEVLRVIQQLQDRDITDTHRMGITECQDALKSIPAFAPEKLIQECLYGRCAIEDEEKIATNIRNWFSQQNKEVSREP